MALPIDIHDTCFLSGRSQTMSSCMCSSHGGGDLVLRLGDRSAPKKINVLQILNFWGTTKTHDFAGKGQRNVYRRTHAHRWQGREKQPPVVLCKTAQLPPPCDWIEQVSSLTALRVVINDQMTATDHVSSLLASCSCLLYALRMLRSVGPWNSASRFDEWHLQSDSHIQTSLLCAGVIGILFSERSNAPGCFSALLSQTWVLWQWHQQ